MTLDPESEDYLFAYCAKDIDQILAMIRRVAKLVFPPELAAGITGRSEPIEEALLAMTLGRWPDEEVCDETIVGFGDEVALEQVGAMIQELPREEQIALAARLARSYRLFLPRQPGAYLVRADPGFLMFELFWLDGKGPLDAALVEGDRWHYELNPSRPPDS